MRESIVSLARDQTNVSISGVQQDESSIDEAVLFLNLALKDLGEQPEERS